MSDLRNDWKSFCDHVFLAYAINMTGYPAALSFLLALCLMICCWSRVPRRFM
jgi:hypothetical protein